MRKRSQLREILPIYPAMPFPPLARFDRRSTIRAKGIGPNDLAAPTGTHYREKSCQTGKENGAENAVQTADFSSAAAPLFHWHCRGQDKGSKTARNEERMVATSPSSLFFVPFGRIFLRICQMPIWRVTIRLSRRSAILGGGRHREELAAGHFFPSG
jgi:hypothetical protein